MARPTKALEACQALAHQEDPEAMAALGCRYYEGLELPQDFQQARHWFERAAAQGNALAKVYLGYCHYYGRDIPRDLERAHQLFSEAAGMGHHNGMYKLGDMHYNGHHVPRDYAQAFLCFQRAEAACPPESPEAPNIAYRLGHCHLEGHGTPLELLTALDLLHRAESGCYRLLAQGDAYAGLTLVRVQEDLERTRRELDRAQPYRTADLGYHNPLEGRK